MSLRKRPMLFGWKIADKMEAEGTVELGDLKQNRNGSLSYWSSDSKWEPLTREENAVRAEDRSPA